MGQKILTPAASAAEAAGRRTGVRYQVLAWACSLAVVTYIHRVGFATASPAIQADLGLSTKSMGYLGAAFLFAYGLFEVPWGLLGDRLGVRHLLMVLVLGWSLLTGLVALVVYVPATAGLPLVCLLVLRALFGLFQAGGFPALSRMMTDWMPMQERGTAQGLIWMSSRLGGALVPLLMAALLAWLGNWRTPLWLIAGLGGLWCLGFWPWFRNRPEEMPQVNAAEEAYIRAGRGAPAGHALTPWAALLRSRNVWALCITYACGGFAANFYVTLLPIFLTKVRGFSDSEARWLQSLPLACGIVGCVTGGMLSDWIIRRTGNRKWGRRLNGTIGMAVGSLGWLALSQATELVAVGTLLCLIFFCNDLCMGPIWASCADVGRRYAGTVGGAMNMIGNLAGAGGNLLTGWLFERGEQSLLFTGFALSFFLASVCWQAIDVTRPLPVPD